MSLTYNGTSGPVRGIETAETSVNGASYSVRVFPYVNDYLEGITGEPIARAVSSVPSAEITFEGEVTGSTGWMAFTVTAAATIANDHTQWGANAGILLLQEATETQSRGGWRSMSATLLKHPLITS